MKKRYDRPLRAEELAKLQDSDIDTTEMPPLSVAQPTWILPMA